MGWHSLPPKLRDRGALVFVAYLNLAVPLWLSPQTQQTPSVFSIVPDKIVVDTVVKVSAVGTCGRQTHFATMFDELFDAAAAGGVDPTGLDLEVPALRDVAPVAVAPAAGGNAPRRMGHHRTEEKHTLATRLKMKLARARHHLRSADQKAAILRAHIAPSFSTRVAKVCVASMQPDDHKVVMTGQSESLDMPLSRRGKQSDDYKNALKYGLYSVVSGQAEGLAELVQPPGGAISLTSVNQFDDASMWVKDPAPKEDRASGLRSEGMKYQGKLWRRGNTLLYQS